MWYLRQLKEPPFEVFYSILSGIAGGILNPFIPQSQFAKLLLYTLIVEFFE